MTASTKSGKWPSDGVMPQDEYFRWLVRAAGALIALAGLAACEKALELDDLARALLHRLHSGKTTPKN